MLMPKKNPSFSLKHRNDIAPRHLPLGTAQNRRGYDEPTPSIVPSHQVIGQRFFHKAVNFR
jgi:hypothetical protein